MLKRTCIKALLLGSLCLVLLIHGSSQNSTNLDSTAVEKELAVETDDLTDEVLEDTLPVKERTTNHAVLEKLKKDRDFDYTQASTVGETLWERFWRWVGQFLSELLRGAVTTDWGRILIYVASLIILILIVFALLKVDAFKVLFKGADSPSGSGVFHENIHEMDFENLIKEAAAKRDFRNAVRLVFLYSLKLLSDSHHIHWEPGKTNHDYLNELKASEIRNGLGELSFYFEYAWYGGLVITDGQYDRVKNIFSDWRAIIQ